MTAATATAGAPAQPPSAAPPSAAPTFAPTTTAASSFRRLRLPLALGAVVVLVAVLVALFSGAGTNAALDPGSYNPTGTHALAALSGARGSPVTRVDNVEAGPGATATVVVPSVALLSGRQRTTLLTLARSTTVVAVVDDDAFGLTPDPVGASGAVHEPGCAFPPAVTAGAVTTGTATLTTEGSGAVPADGFALSDSCYSAGLLAEQALTGAGELILLSDAQLFTNQRLAENGNAALSLLLLDHSRPVLWWQPHDGAADAGDGQAGVFELLPFRLRLALLQVVVAVGALVLWRVRRLGPVVPERLPVVVRAVETVRGRARLYRSAQARDRAALALREATRAALARRLGLGPATTAPALVAAVATQVRRPAGEVGEVLYGSGAAPPDDASLVALAASLDALRREAEAR